MSVAVLSLGSNLGWKKRQIRRALQEIGRFSKVRSVSRFYRTEPYGKTDQPCFINAAAEIETSREPEDLLNRLMEVETKLGRTRKEKWGPRGIDIDLIFFDDRVVKTQRLIVPHPDMQNREFVLIPLMDICPRFIHPIFKKSVREMLNELTLSGKKPE